jgi:hypothetical protein
MILLFVLPLIIGMMDVYHWAQPLIEMSLENFLPELALNYDLHELYLPSS